MPGLRFRLSELIRETRHFSVWLGVFSTRARPGRSKSSTAVWRSYGAHVKRRLVWSSRRFGRGRTKVRMKQNVVEAGRACMRSSGVRGMSFRLGRAGVDRDGNWRSPASLPRERNCTTVAMALLASQCGGWKWAMTIRRAATSMRKSSETPSSRRSRARFPSRGCRATLSRQ